MMDIDQQLAMLRPTIEVETLVREVVSRRVVETLRRGDQLDISRSGAETVALHCYPAVVSMAVDPARARALEGSPLVERVESKTAATSYVWVPTTRLRGALDEAVELALEALDRRPLPAAVRSSTRSPRTPRSPAAPRERVTRAPAAPPPPEPKICPRCGLQISAAGTCFCD